MKDGVVSEWFSRGSDVAAAEMRAAIARSRMGWPQLLHHHAHGEPCSEQCETIDDPAKAEAP